MSKKQNFAIPYRREIDGLRALAVIPVILFHAGVPSMDGGYVGVDVFFVISGYLITSIIVNELKTDSFSIMKFYERRARRILPALFFVSLVCIPFAWLFLDAPKFKDFCQSLIAVVFFGSNILFWRETGYFASQVETKPLIHTWSLAVEEQFYFLFAIFMFITWRIARNLIAPLLILLAVASFALTLTLIEVSPSAAFYLLPTRIWELVVGALVSFYLSKHDAEQRGSAISNFLALLGLTLLVICILGFDNSLPYPSYYTIVPVLGTSLVIIFTTGKTVLRKILSQRSLVGIGLMSYSLYLWHQPVLAFSKVLNGGELPLYLSFVVLITIFCLSLLSWRYVELPFRKQIDFKNAAQVKLALVSVSLLLLVGALGHLKNGFERDQSQSLEVNSSKKITNENFFVLGDSHAEHLVAGIQSITTGKVTALVSAGCIPFRNVDRYDSRLPKGECAKKSNMWLDEVLKIDPKATVILTSMGPVYLEGTAFKGMDTARVTGLGVELINDKSEKNRYRVFEIGMENTLSELSKLRNSLIVYAIDVPELGIKNGCQIRSKSIAIYGSILTDFTETTKPDHCNIPRSQYEERSTKYRNLVRSVVNEFPNIKLFDPIDTFCDRSKCDGYKIKYGYLYQDADHLSGSGSRLYAENLFKFIEKEVAKRK